MNQFQTTGTVLKRQSTGMPKKSLERMNFVLDAFIWSPKKSIRREVELSIPRPSFHRILHSVLKFTFYKMVVIQELLKEDDESRVSSCKELIEMLESDALYLPNLIFSEEATFHTSDKVNAIIIQFKVIKIRTKSLNMRGIP